jgi:uncharacterized membrane protein YdjX (TVP38/TMEM64 family)
MKSPVPARHSRVRWVPVVSGVTYAALICAAYFFVDLPRVHAWAEGLHGLLVFVLLSLLPLFGLPVSVLYFIVGAKFGLGIGLLLSAFAIAIHLLGIHWIGTSFLRGVIRELLQRTRYRLPDIPARGRTALGMLTALLPGPYSVKNYLLAIGGLPLKPFFLGCWPVYIVQASSGILFGDLSGRITLGRTILFITYAVLITCLGRYVLKVWRTEQLQRARQPHGHP